MPNQSINKRVVLTQPITSSYTPGSAAFFAALPTQPEARVKAAYNNMWLNYPAVQSLHDLQYQNVALYEDNKRTSLINPGSYYQSKISTPTFNVFGGIIGGTGKAYDSGFIPSTHAVNYTLTNACFWVYNGSANTLFNRTMIGCSVAGEAGSISATMVSSNPSFAGAINGYTAFNGGISGFNDFYGLWSVHRSGTTVKVYHNAVLKITVTDTAIALPNCSFYELAWNLAGVLTLPYTGKVYASGICSGNVNQTDLYNMLKNYMGDLPLYKFYGDSIFSGYNLSNPQTESIPYLLSVGKGQYQFNNSIAGTTVKDFIDSGVQIEKTNRTDGYVFFDWFINDASAGLGTTVFKTNYRLAIDMAIASGCPASRIRIVKNWYITDSSILSIIPPYVVAAQEVADEYGITTFDLSSITCALQGDGFHPTAAGCVTAANYIISQIP